MSTSTMRTAAAVVSLAVASACQGLAAQVQLPVIRSGQQINESLSATDPFLQFPKPPAANGSPNQPAIDSLRIKGYRFDAVSGRLYEITLSSSAFDATLVLAKAVSGLTHILKSDHHQRGGNVSRIVFRAPDSGPFVVAVGGSEAGAGAFGLRIYDLPSIAPAVRPIATGQTINGAVTDRDAIFDETGTHYATYELQGRKGQNLRIELTVSGFDGWLAVGKTQPAPWKMMVDADTGGVDKSEGLTFVTPEDGRYQVRVIGVGTVDTGSFVLRVSEAPPRRTTPETRPILAGAPAQGVLDDDAATDSSGYRIQQWTYVARAGEHDLINLSSGAFDTYLTVGRITAGKFVTLGTDDDGGTGTNSRLEFTARDSGEYVIGVRSEKRTSQSGTYTLQVEQRPVRTTPETRPIATNSEVAGALKDDAAIDSHGYSYQHWIFRARPGERVLINLSSKAFDPYLFVGRIANGRFVAADSNDDIAKDTTASRLAFIARDSGEYAIRVRSVNLRAQTGAYTLRLSVRPPTRATPETRAIAISGEMTGTLDDNDASLDDGSPYDHWTFAADSGAHVVITMRSKTIDAFLMLGQMQRGHFVEIARDDDGGGGSDARIMMTAPRTGEYVIRANTFGPAQKGEYTLKIERTGPPKSP